MITDICIFIAIIFFSVHGFKKGFIKSVYSLLSVFATLFLLYILKDYFINEVSKTELGVAIGNFFSGNDEFDFITQRISTAVISFVSTLILYIFIKFILKFVLKIITSWRLAKSQRKRDFRLAKDCEKRAVKRNFFYEIKK